MCETKTLNFRKTVRGTYRIVTGFILDRPFINIGTMYFSIIFTSDKSQNAFDGVSFDTIRYDSAYYTYASTSSL